MSDPWLPRETVEGRRALAPADALRAFSAAVFAGGALDKRTIAVPVAHVTQGPWCIEGHVKAAGREGASAKHLMEAIRVAAEVRAAASGAQTLKAVQAMGGGPG